MLNMYFAGAEILAMVWVSFVVPRVIGIQSTSVQLLSNRKYEIVLECHTEGSSGDVTVEWFHNTEKLSTLQNIQLQENRLIIRRPSNNDSGLYRCIASNSAGHTMSKKGYVLKWFGNTKDEERTSSCIPRRKKKQNLPSFSQNEFLCRGKRSETGDILTGSKMLPMVKGARIEQGPSGKQVVNESVTIELPCQYYIPTQFYKLGTVHLHWLKDGKILRQVELGPSTSTTAEPNMETVLRDDTRITLNRQNGSLIFQSVIASDAGLYHCQVYIYGYRPMTSDICELQIIDQLRFAPQPTSKNLELGSVGKVHCKAHGTPMPAVKWITNINSESLLPAKVDDINGTLIFKNVTAEHRGNYTCIAINAQGQINATVSINVVVAPKFSLPPEGPIEIIEMGVVAMHCQAIGDPKPTIQWDKDLKYLSENNTDRTRFRFLENGTLEIRDVNLEDEGRYGCTIGNSAGLKREEVQFIVKSSEFISESSDGFLITPAVFITMSVASAYIILVVGLMIWCRFRHQARKARLNEDMRDNVVSCEGGKIPEIEPCLPVGNSSRIVRTKLRKANVTNNPDCTGNETGSSAHSKGSKKSHAYNNLALLRSNITEIVQIGRGEFGDVYVGKINISFIKVNDETDADTDSTKDAPCTSGTEKRRSKTSMVDIEEIREEQDGGNDEIHLGSGEYKLVLIKAMNKMKDENARQEFKRQIEMFRAITHKGVVRLFGLCKEKDPHYMVLEYADWGDLKQFLLATAGRVNTLNSNSSTDSPPPLKTGQILAVAYQIARGMDAIYRAGFIHKDLATRNCVISSNFIVKVSCPALSKDKYNREYFKHRSTLLPVRWLAPECIKENEFTTKSDIFAFGVVVWELFNKATKMPFEELSNEDIVQLSQAGTLNWKCAAETPACLHEILISCWIFNPNERPSFSQLCTALSKAIQNGDK